MEYDFDKEIDALLRTERRDTPVLVGDVAGAAAHLDADEISAFAENALPETYRAERIAHLAECDPCRKHLSNVLVLGRDAPLAVAAPASAITSAERELPWYRRLLLFPNLAYVMGSLVLVFGGFLAVTVIRNSQMGESQIVSQATDAESRQGGPNFQDEPATAQSIDTDSFANAAANVAVSNTAGLSSNSNRSASAAAERERGPLAESALRDDSDASGARVDLAAPPAPSLPSPAAREVRTRDDLVKSKGEDRLNEAVVTQNQADGNYAGVSNQQQGVPVQSGPMRNNERQYERQLENNKEKRAAADKSALRDEESSGRRVVGGRTFERKEGVWYDTRYQGRPTINVRRGSDEFKRLDAGLRSIANDLSGTIVVVWGAKAYRIQ
jgi:hypothetical protein